VTSKTQVTSSLTKLAAACALSLHTHILELTLGTVVAGSLTAAVPARAETIDELLDLLKAKGALTEPEYDRLKARHQAEAKGGEEKLRAAEAKAREAEANARAAEAKALRTASLSVPPMAAKAPVPYVTALPNCVGVRAGQVDICVKGDLVFFGVEQFPDKNLRPPFINGGLATASQKNSNSVSVGLLPSSIQVSINTQQSGIDLGAYFGAYVGGNNINWGTFGANNGGSPVALGTAGIDFRQVYGTLGTPTFGTVKVGRDLGMFAADAILNDATLFGVGTPVANFAPNNTTLGRIGLGYIYADWIPQISYKSPSFYGLTWAVGLFTPLDEVPVSGDPQSATLTGHDQPSFQGQLKYVGTFMPDTKLTLSTSGVVQRQEADCTASIPTFGTSSCIGAAPLVSSPLLVPGTAVTAWAVDGFGRLDVYGLSLVGYGYTGKGVGTTGLFRDGVDARGSTRRSFGGYGQASYTFYNVFTVGGSWGISVLDIANVVDAAAEFAQCTSAARCLVHQNQSWIGFVRYKLTNWVNLQAEYVNTRASNQIGQTITDNAILAGTTFFW
jgi:predicted porin